MRIVGIALPVLAVLAVLLATALIPQHGYSNQQVLRAFKSEGLPLHLREWNWGRNTAANAPVESVYFYRSRDHQFSVIVFHPRAPQPRGDLVRVAAPTTTAWARNVAAYWTTYTLEPGEATRIHAALTRLAGG